jgi:hypothetical protein
MFTKWSLFLNKRSSALIEKIKANFPLKGNFFEDKILVKVISLSLVSPILVLLVSLAFFYQQSLLDEKMDDLEKKVRSLVTLKKQEGKFVNKFIASDINFLEHFVSTLSLLKEDAALIEKIGKQVNYQPLKDRFNFLIGGENQIQFKPELVRRSTLYNEVEWKMAHRVEVNVKDIIQVVSLIEGVKMYQFVPNLVRPQLIIKNFSLESKGSVKEANFFLNLEILQRNANEKE